MTTYRGISADLINAIRDAHKVAMEKYPLDVAARSACSKGLILSAASRAQCKITALDAKTNMAAYYND